MHLKLEEMNQAKRAKRAQKRKQMRKSWKERFFLSSDSNFLQSWDAFVTFIAFYSCLSSMWFIALGQPCEYPIFNVMEWLTVLIFLFDICFNFMRLRRKRDGEVPRDHLFIAK